MGVTAAQTPADHGVDVALNVLNKHTSTDKWGKWLSAAHCLIITGAAG